MNKVDTQTLGDKKKFFYIPSTQSSKTINSIQDISTVSNDYPCITGGNWVAIRKSDGKTYYSNNQGFSYFKVNGQDYSGPVNFLNISSLTIRANADVNAANIMGTSFPTVTILSGGTFENSTFYNGFLQIASGGNSQNNIYVSIASGGGGINGTSQSDVFIEGGDNDMGTANLSQAPAFTRFKISDDISNMTIGTTGRVFDPIQIVNDTTGNNNTKFTLAAGSYYGPSADYGVVNGVDSSHITINNTNPVLLTTDTWTAMLKSDGKTYYTKDGGNSFFQVNGQDYSGPINIVNGDLIIENGAVVDGANIFGNIPTITIRNGGTLQNSSVFNGYLYMDDGSTSFNNKYYSMVADTGLAGNLINDSFYGTANGTTGQFNFTDNQLPNGIFVVGDNANDINFSGNAKLKNVHLLNQSGNSMNATFNNGTLTTICYLAGTLIESEQGEVKIETLKVGDRIYSYQQGKKILKEIKWISTQHHIVNPDLPDDLASCPVHIVRNALANNIPHKDMKVTPEHCLFLNGKFIPVRMLVNGYSIYYDHSIASYDYYHLELEEHSIIMADGVLSESYLNTNNHKHFHQNDNIITLKPHIKTWEKDAAAPLATDRKIVEPLYYHFKERARQLELPRQCTPIRITCDPDFHLITEQGKVLFPHHQNKENHYIFILPHDIRELYLHSRSSRPSDAIGPFVDDRRELGVLVGAITLFDRNKTRTIQQHLEKITLWGWHDWENDRCRWTKGDAILLIDNIDAQDTRILVVHLIAAGPYVYPQSEPHQLKKVVNG